MKRVFERSVSQNIEEYVQDWLPFETSFGGVLKTKDNRYVKIVEIEPITFLLRSEEERMEIIDMFYSWLKVAPNRLQFYMTTTHMDSSSLEERIRIALKDETDPHVIKRKDELLAHMKEISNTDALSKRFYIIYQYEGSKVDQTVSDDISEIWSELESTKVLMKSYFGKMGNSIVEHENELNFAGKVLYKALNPRTSMYESFENRIQRVVTDATLMTEKDEVVSEIDEKDFVSCRGIDFSNNTYCVKDGIYTSYLYLKKKGYKNRVYSGWFEAFTNFGEGITVSMTAIKKPKFQTQENVGRALRWKISESKDRYRPEEEAEGLLGEAENARFIKGRMESANEDMYDVFTMLTIHAETLEELQKKEANIKMVLKSQDFFVGDATNHIEEATRMSLPLLCVEKKLFEKGKRNFLTSSLASTYMYTAFELFDEKGVVLGLNGSNSSLVVVDPFNSKKFPNANMIILGTSGMGKTFLLMTLAYNIRLTGKPVFIILPEKGHEWKKMVQAMGGEFIELSPGSKDCINIMAIRPQKSIDEEFVLEYEEYQKPLLAKKVHQIITFLQLNMTKDEMTDEEEASISTLLVQLYAEYGITSDNSSIWEDEDRKILKKMPVIEDFYKKAKSDPVLCQRIATILNIYVTGDGKNMNAQTNVNLDSKFVAISVSNAEKRMIAPYAFVAVDCCYDTIKADRSENCALIMDEVWKFMLNNYASEYVMEIYKIIRGFGGSAISATQELEDLNKSKHAAGIINNAKLKFMLGAEKRQTRDLQDMVDLTEDEMRYIAGQERGQALFIANGDKVPIFIRAPKNWEELFTTDPMLLRKIKRQLLGY